MYPDKHHGRRVIVKNSILNLLGQVLPMVVGVLTIPYIVRGLGTDAYGILSIAFMVLGYFSIFDLGLSRATVKFVAENLSPEKIHKIPELVWTSFSLLVLMGCLGGALAATIVPVSVTHWFKMPVSFMGQARTALFILSASMPIMLGNDCLRGVLEAAQRFDLVNIVRVPASVLFYLVAALVIPFGVHVPGIVALMVLIRLTSTCAYLFFCFRVFPGLKTHFRISKASVKPLAVFGGWIMVSNITNPIFGYLERFMIATVLNVGMLTYYSVPTDLVCKIAIFPMSIVPSLFPYFSYHGGTKSRAEVSHVTVRAVKYLLLILTPIVAVFIFFARDILQLWLGPQFAANSTGVMQIVALVFFVNAFAIVPYTSVQALGRPDLKAILDLCILPVYAAASWWWMKRSGVNGAAHARLMVTIIDCVCLYIFASKLKAFSLRDCASGALFRALLACGGLFLAIFTVQSFHEKLPIAILLALACTVAYVAIFWVIAVDQEDRTTIGGLRVRAFDLLRRRKASPAMQMTGTDVGP